MQFHDIVSISAVLISLVSLINSFARSHSERIKKVEEDVVRHSTDIARCQTQHIAIMSDHEDSKARFESIEEKLSRVTDLLSEVKRDVAVLGSKLEFRQ